MIIQVLYCPSPSYFGFHIHAKLQCFVQICTVGICTVIPFHPFLHPLMNAMSTYFRSLTRQGCSALLPGTTHTPRLFALSSTTTNLSNTASCVTPSAKRTPRLLRQTTISNPEELDAVRTQVLTSCLKCTSYPQLTDSQLQILT